MKRVARIVAVLGAASIAACFSKPGEPHVGNGDGGIGSSDADAGGGTGRDAGSDATSTTCPSQPQDTFTSGTSCGAIGSAYGPGSAVTRVNNQLSIEPSGSAAGCTSLSAFDFSHGTSVQIAQISLSAMVISTEFHVRNGADTAQGMDLYLTNSTSGSIIDVGCTGVTGTSVEVNYDPVAQLYWKFEAMQGTVVRLYYSADGSSWMDIGASCSWSSVATVTVDIGVSATADPSATTALFDDFNVKTCQ